jgi:hypothetical protein
MGALGAGASSETLALGDVPNIASRVQSAAEPGTVLITAATLHLVAGLFVLEERGSLSLAGMAAPVALHRVQQVSGIPGRIHAAATGRSLTRFVGRELERQLLRERWERAQEGEGQVVLISGEPGIGKSRLVQQFKQDLAGEAHRSRLRRRHATHPFAVLQRCSRRAFSGRRTCRHRNSREPEHALQPWA